MKILKSVLLACVLFSQITVYASYAPFIDEIDKTYTSITSQNPRESTVLSENDIDELLIKNAPQMSIKDLIFLKEIIFCESSFNTNAKNLSDIEESYGLSQINTMVHDVSIEQATDPEFAIKFLIEHYQQGKAPQMWKTCYKRATLK